MGAFVCDITNPSVSFVLVLALVLGKKLLMMPSSISIEDEDEDDWKGHGFTRVGAKLIREAIKF